MRTSIVQGYVRLALGLGLGGLLAAGAFTSRAEEEPRVAPPLPPVAGPKLPSGQGPRAEIVPLDGVAPEGNPAAVPPQPGVSPAENSAPAAAVTPVRVGPQSPPPKPGTGTELADFAPSGPVQPHVQQVYDALADLKKQITQIAADLDDNGKERTRLNYNTEQVGKTVTALAKVWPKDEPSKTLCLNAKRRALVLEEELRSEPRKWIHLRYAFRALQMQVRDLRVAFADKAQRETPPVTVVTKDGKTLYVAPVKSPAELESDAEEQRRLDRDREKENFRKHNEFKPGRGKDTDGGLD